MAVALSILSGAPAAATGPEWSPFAPIGRPVPPRVDDPEWAANPIDAFVLAQLRRAGLNPAPAVDRATWLRRATYDLTGLPPTPAEVVELLEDPRPDAEARAAVVDRLLASPAHGERWARHWLDVVRYADSDGFAIDAERPTLWRYRDHVVRALNEDRPFDRFVREQLAGDEIGAGSGGLVATGFYRLGPYEADNMVPENRRQDYLNEVTSALGSAFLGLTLNCARCHDHKYDPISTRDFYSLQAFLEPIVHGDRSAEFSAAELTVEVERQKKDAEAELSRRAEELNRFREELREKLAAAEKKDVTAIDDRELDAALGKDEPFSAEEKKRHEALKKAVSDYKHAKRYQALACAVSSPSPESKPRPTRILLGGEVSSPGEAVSPAFLTAIEPWSSPIFERLPALAETTSGRRAVLADWLTSAHNPLPARVIVNRLWQYHVGVGLVATSNDFGRNGSGVSHPELLDFLARRFLDGGQRLKPIHRLIVLSRTYRSSTVHPAHADCARIDPENRRLWRGHFRRLEAETVRDAMLAVSGRLSRSMGGPGFYEELPAELGRSFPFFTWDPSDEDQRRRRSLYMFQRRNLVHPMIEAFDSADLSESCERRRISVTTPQVFSLFNSEFSHEIARHFARRVRREVGDEAEAQIVRIFWLAFSRAPRESEVSICRKFLDEQAALHGDDEKAAERALVDLCLVSINANEFLYLE